MTSFASAFGSSDQEDNYSNNVYANLTNNNNDNQGLRNFSSINLDEQATSSKEDSSSYLTFHDAAVTLQTDTSSTAGAIPHRLSYSPSYSSQERSSSIIKIFQSFSLKIFFFFF